MKKYKTMFVFVFALVISGLCFWYGSKLTILYVKVKGWTKTEATVLSKEVFRHKKYSTSRTPYGIKVNYKYTFRNKEYTSNKVSLIELMGGQSNYMQSDAETIISELSAKPQIYVNPGQPEQSVIFCEGIWLDVLILLVGFISLLIGIGSIIK